MFIQVINSYGLIQNKNIIYIYKTIYSEACVLHCIAVICSSVSTAHPMLTQNGGDFADDTFKCIFLNENVWIPINISLNFVPKGPFNNIPAMVKIMAWRRPGDKPLSEPMMVELPTHIYVTRPHWVKHKCCDKSHRMSFVVDSLQTPYLHD